MTSGEIVRLECAKLAALALSENEVVRPKEVLDLTRGLIELVAEKQSAVLFVMPTAGDA